MDSGVCDLTFSPAGSKILYNRKRADESDAAASKQGDTASPEKRNAVLFRFFRRYYDCYAVRSVRRNFISFLGNAKERGAGRKRVPLPLQGRVPGGPGAGALPEKCGKPKTFPQGKIHLGI